MGAPAGVQSAAPDVHLEPPVPIFLSDDARNRTEKLARLVRRSIRPAFLRADELALLPGIDPHPFHSAEVLA